MARVAPALTLLLGVLLTAETRSPESHAFENIRNLERSGSLNSSDAAVETELALNYVVLGQRNLAQSAIQRALQLNPQSARAHYLAGRLALELEQNPRAAIQEFQRTLDLEPNSFKAWYYIGTGYSELGLHEAARSSLLKATETATYSWPYRSLAETDLLLNRLPEALQAAIRAVDIEPSAAENCLTAAKVYHAVGDPGKAIASAEQAIRADPFWDAPHFLLAKIYAQLPGKKAGTAEELLRFTELKDQNPGTGVAVAPSSGAPQARSAAELGAFGDVALAAEPIEIIRAGERFLSRFPASEFQESVLQAEFQAFRARNDYAAVRRTGGNILKLNPENMAVLAELALLISNQGDTSSFADAADYAARVVRSVSGLPRPEKMMRREFVAWKARVLASAHAAQGILALRKNEAVQAISELQRGIRLNSDLGGQLYLRLGEAFVQNHQVVEARKAFAQAEALGPEFVSNAARLQGKAIEPLENLSLGRMFSSARDLEKAGNLQGAAQAYEQISVSHPEVPEVLHNLGLVYYQMRDYSKAANCLQRALRLHADLDSSRLFLGLAQFRLAQFNESAVNLELLLQRPQVNRETYLFLTRDYLALGRFRRDILDHALAVAASDAEVNYAIGMSCLEHIRLLARKANDSGPQSAESLWMNLRRAEQRQDAKSIDQYTRELSGAGEPALIRDYDSTVELLDHAFQTVLRVAPSSGEAHSVRGYILEARNDLEAALREYQAANDNFQAGRLLAQSARYGEAEQAFAAAVNQDPQNDRAKADLAKTYLQTSQPDKAASLLSGLTKRYPTDAYAWADLGKAHSQLGDTESATTCLRKALELDPAMNQVHYQLAMLYRRIGKMALATQELLEFERHNNSKR